MTLRFTVPGRVQPWQRTGGFGARRFTRPETAAFEALVGWHAKAAHRGPPFSGPTAVSIVAVFERPDRRPATVPPEVWRTGERCWRISTPDRDNVDKAVLDGLTKAGVLADDAIVCGGGEVLKVYAAAANDGPCTIVEVWALGWAAVERAAWTAGGVG